MPVVAVEVVIDLLRLALLLLAIAYAVQATLALCFLQADLESFDIRQGIASSMVTV